MIQREREKYMISKLVQFKPALLAWAPQLFIAHMHWLNKIITVEKYITVWENFCVLTYSLIRYHLASVFPASRAGRYGHKNIMIKFFISVDTVLIIITINLTFLFYFKFKCRFLLLSEICRKSFIKINHWSTIVVYILRHLKPHI